MSQRKYTTEIGRRRRRYHALYLATVIVLSIASLIVLVLLLLLRTPIFRVNSVNIEGNSYIPTFKIENLLRGRVTGDSWTKNFLGFHNMLAWPDQISASDLKYLPEANSISIQKSYLHHSVLVSVHERDREGIWCFKGEGSSCFWFDAEGMINPAPASEGSLISVVNDYSRTGIPYGEKLLPADMFVNLISILETIKQVNLSPKEIRLNDLSLEEIKVPTYDGPTLEFSLRFPATNITAALRELSSKVSISTLEYIDFRVENRVYYK